MGIRIVRLGTPRFANEGTRLGTVRRPPRGVKKTDFARKNYYDVWVPDLSPSEQLRSWVKYNDWTPERWKRFTKDYVREMKDPHAARLIAMLAAMSHDSNFSVGCYCEDEERCHRSILEKLLRDAGAEIVD